MPLADFLFMVIHSKEFFPVGHPLHNVCYLGCGTLAAFAGAGYLGIVILRDELKRWYVRRTTESEFDRWTRLARKSKGQKP